MAKKHDVFSVFGIEAEYMIVDSDSLKVRPIADQLLAELNSGEICNQVELGRVSWSNELVNHVVEIKCTDPEPELNELDVIFHASIMEIQERLQKWNCRLLATSMHPWFNPLKECVLWPHEQREIYSLYNEIFDCKGHGWSNLQSVHINLPYANEKEFVDLHSAIRVVLPLIPYFAASSLFYDGKLGDLADNRLAFYEKNQAKVPSIIGNIIPENVQSMAEYNKILSGIYADIAHYENTKILQQPWLNSRAAIPKFDVGAIEIRLMDIQECPYMDFALVYLVVELVKFVYYSKDTNDNMEIHEDRYLRATYEEAKKFLPSASLDRYFDLFHLKAKDGSFTDLRQQLIEKFKGNIPESYHRGLNIFANAGSFSQRVYRKALSIELYREIASCLVNNNPYEG